MAGGASSCGWAPVAPSIQCMYHCALGLTLNSLTKHLFAMAHVLQLARTAVRSLLPLVECLPTASRQLRVGSFEVTETELKQPPSRFPTDPLIEQNFHPQSTAQRLFGSRIHGALREALMSSELRELLVQTHGFTIHAVRPSQDRQSAGKTLVCQGLNQSEAVCLMQVCCGNAFRATRRRVRLR
jgi:hypothetical protein